MVTLHIAGDIHRAQRADIEGPSKAQARRMAATRAEFLARARALEATAPDTAAELDFDAWDIETDLRRYGFDVETGRPAKGK